MGAQFTVFRRAFETGLQMKKIIIKISDLAAHFGFTFWAD